MKESDTIRALRGDRQSIMSVLEDNIIKEIYIDTSQEYLKIISIDDIFIFHAVGDCCSESWFADIIGVSYLLNCEVYSVVDIEDCYANDDRSRQERDIIYGIKITTNKGICDIVFRNSSNGYYGGYLEIVKHDISHLDLNFIDIVDDWSA